MWLGRGAPKRWFAPTTNTSAPLFAVTDAPTSVGRISFTVAAGSPSEFEYTVDVVPRAGAVPSYSDVPWVLRFVSPASGAKISGTCVSGCEVVSTDSESGMVRIKTSATHFVVRGTTA